MICHHEHKKIKFLSYLIKMIMGSGILCASDVIQAMEAIDQNAQQNTTLPAIHLKAQEIDGHDDQGYRSEQVSQTGPWQGRKLQDLPYSVNVISEALINNLQSTSSPDAVYRINPIVQVTRSQYENDQPTFLSRGFKVSTIYRDGLPGDQYGHGTTMEDTEKLEMFNGLSGFLYGAGNVGGMVNYVSKRSTVDRFNNIGVGSVGGKSWLTTGDFGGKFDDEGTFGYRINLSKQGGDTAIDQLEVEKEFASLSLDWNILDNLQVQLDMMHRDYNVNGNTADWIFAKGVKRYSAHNFANDVSWGQPWMNNDYQSKRYGLHLNWDISDQLKFRTSYLNSFSRRTTQSATNTVNADGTFTQQVSRIYADGQNRVTSEQYDESTASYLDYSFHTGAIKHKLTAGLQNVNSIQKRYQNEAGNKSTYTSTDFNSPIYVDPSDGFMVDRGQLNKRSESTTTNWLLGDDIQFNAQWSALLGASYVNIHNKITDYDASQISPNISIIYKPFVQLTTYATYIDSLESGGIAPETANGRTVTNAGQVFDPLMSKQIEFGSKYTLNDRLAFNTAIFQINKGLQYSENINETTARYVQDGRQVHQGIEFTTIGKLTDALTVIGGLTWLNAEVKEQKQNPHLEGKHPAEVAQKIAKIYTEYSVAQVENLHVSAGIDYTGKRFADALNTDELPAFTLLNLGARYQFDVDQYPITLRLNMNNVLNKKYWANSTMLGDPRTVIFSANFKF